MSKKVDRFRCMRCNKMTTNKAIWTLNCAVCSDSCASKLNRDPYFLAYYIQGEMEKLIDRYLTTRKKISKADLTKALSVVKN